jgi:oligopeptide transport system permease protein
MLILLVRRLLWAVPVLFAVVVVTFLLLHLVPGGPWDNRPQTLAMFTVSADSATRKTLDRRFGLDKPLWRQFIRYVFGDLDENGEFVCGLICGDLGPSYRQRGSTAQDMLFKAPEGKPFWQSSFFYSIRLALLALLLALVVGIPAGMVAALKQDTWIDHGITFVATLGLSVPSFVIGLFLIATLVSAGVSFSVVPRSWSDPGVWIAPVVVLSLGTMAATTRLTRASLLEVMRADYVRTARAKGLAERTIVSAHMLKNALIPVVTLLGPALAELIAGSFVIEMMFGFPGMGRIYTDSVIWKDYPLILAATLVYAMLVTFVNLGVDFAYGLLDPRIRAR